MNPNEEFKIPLTNTLIQSIGDYLITRPYREVALLINSLQTEVTAATQPSATNTSNGVIKSKLDESVEAVGDLQ